MAEYYVSWWNLENFFDVENSPDRPEWLQKRLGKELAGWNEQILGKKTKQIASIISKMNNGYGPDILGVCEVENKSVLENLVDKLSFPDRSYGIAHHDTEDKRGIDIAFIFDTKKFDIDGMFSHVVLKREATRDIFQINLKIQKTKQDLIVIGNHWPSRMGGELDSEPYRMTAAETLSYWNERIYEEKSKNAPILIMGDFNDEPHNRAITNYALSTNNVTQVLNARSPKVYNLMWGLMGNGLGTHFEGSLRMLDQFMVSRGFLIDESNLKIKENSIDIIRFPEMQNNDPYKSPKRFGRPSKVLNEQGFSDHFPISLIVTET